MCQEKWMKYCSSMINSCTRLCSGLSQCSGLDWWSISHMVISSALSKSTLNIWRFMVHVLLKTGLKNFEHYFASLRDECNCAINPTIELPELTQDWGNRLLEGIKRTLCEPGPKRKKQWPTKDWFRLSCECPGVSSRGMGRWWPAAGSGTLSVAGHGTFSRRHHYLHYLHHSLASGQTTGREHCPPHQDKIGLKIYWAWPCPSE